MSRRTLFIVARVAGWLIVPLYVIGTCAGYFLTYSAGLWNEHAVVDNVESVMFSAGFGPLTVTLALVYFSGVATTQLVFRALTGQQQQPQLAIASPRS